MLTSKCYLLVGSLLLGMTSAALASVGLQAKDPPNPPFVITDIKTPLLKTSETTMVPIELHNDVDIPNWAGFMVKVHVLDGTEVTLLPTSTLLLGGAPLPPDVTGSAGPPPGFFTPTPLITPSFPTSTVAETIPIFRTVWAPAASASGSTFPASGWRPMVVLDLHAKDTEAFTKNSDAPDVSVMGWNIRHLTGLFGSTHFEESASVWATSQFMPTPGNTVPSFRPRTDDPNAHWVHIPFTWHATTLMSSVFVKTLMGTAFIDIMHAPEPGTGLLVLLGGLASLLWGFLLRRRRLPL